MRYHVKSQQVKDSNNKTIFLLKKVLKYVNATTEGWLSDQETLG